MHQSLERIRKALVDSDTPYAVLEVNILINSTEIGNTSLIDSSVDLFWP
jgi:hypothetical protein